MEKAYYTSPLGVLEITGDAAGVHSILFSEKTGHFPDAVPECLKKCVSQLDEYFEGKRHNFDLPLVFTGTEFQKQVWKALSTLPYGKTASYGEVAHKIKKPKAMRAVGNANHKNPHTIVTPCHRVIGSNGQLIGYGGGLWRKEWLLDFERRNR